MEGLCWLQTERSNCSLLPLALAKFATLPVAKDDIAWKQLLQPHIHWASWGTSSYLHVSPCYSSRGTTPLHDYAFQRFELQKRDCLNPDAKQACPCRPGEYVAACTIMCSTSVQHPECGVTAGGWLVQSYDQHHHPTNKVPSRVTQPMSPHAHAGSQYDHAYKPNKMHTPLVRPPGTHGRTRLRQQC